LELFVNVGNIKTSKEEFVIKNKKVKTFYGRRGSCSVYQQRLSVILRALVIA